MALEKVECPIPGTIVSVSVLAGSPVKAGDELCVLESMKIENLISTPVDGTVSQVCCQPGQRNGGGCDPVYHQLGILRRLTSF